MLFYTLLAYGLLGFLLVLVGVAFDYAKIVLVVERRKSALRALLHGLRFLLKHPLSTIGLYFLLLLVGMAVLLAYALVAPGPGQASSLSLLPAILLGQLYLLGRLFVKLWMLAAQTALFRGSERTDLGSVSTSIS